MWVGFVGVDMPPEHGKEGSYVESYTLDAVYGVFEQVPAPVYTSGDVVDALGCSVETARRKLNQLYEEGRLERYKTAERVFYWPADGDTEQTPRDLPVVVGQMLAGLSRDLGEPITVGDTVYEDGDKHPAGEN
jgi:predicted transcriptional regulator